MILLFLFGRCGHDVLKDSQMSLGRSPRTNMDPLKTLISCVQKPSIGYVNIGNSEAVDQGPYFILDIFIYKKTIHYIYKMQVPTSPRSASAAFQAELS